MEHGYRSWLGWVIQQDFVRNTIIRSFFMESREYDVDSPGNLAKSVMVERRRR